MPLRLLLLAALSTPLLAGCTGRDDAEHPVQAAFDDAAEKSGVPAQLLAAVAWSMSRFDQRDGDVNIEGGVGVMNLHVDDQGPTLAEAAALTGLPPERIGTELRANVLGAAMVLAARADEQTARTGNRVDTFEEWYPLVAAWSGAPDPMVADSFAAQVFDNLQYGLSAQTPDGEVIVIEPHQMPWRVVREAVDGAGNVDQYVPACSSNYSNYGRGPGDIDTIVIHDTEGSYSGAVSWFQNCSSQVSAHYVVRSSDGDITQMVQDEDVAWHAGHWDTNERSIGIEHEGYASDPDRWYTDSMYRASAALVSRLCDTYGIPKDRDHIIGHFEVPGCSTGSGGGSGCHTDPGSGWDWDYYMSLVTGSGSGSGSMGGGGLPDGPRYGSFHADVSAPRYGESDACEGPVSGSVTGGRLYLSGTCTLQNHPEKSGDLAVTFAGAANGDKLEGYIFVDGHTAEFVGEIAADGTVTAQFSGAEELGGDVGTLEYSVRFAAAP